MGSYCAKSSISNVFYCINFSIIIKFFFSLSFYQKYCPNFLCGAGAWGGAFSRSQSLLPEPSPGALIKSEAPKKTPDGPKMGGSGEKTPAPEHWLKQSRVHK